MPPVDIEESDREYLIKVELPGMKKEDVKLTVEGGTLSISGERKAEREEKDKKYHRFEAATAHSRVALHLASQPRKSLLSLRTEF
jgi:HSP20 family molecular chaperone IbpA